MIIKRIINVTTTRYFDVLKNKQSSLIVNMLIIEIFWKERGEDSIQIIDKSFSCRGETLIFVVFSISPLSVFFSFKIEFISPLISHHFKRNRDETRKNEDLLFFRLGFIKVEKIK